MKKGIVVISAVVLFFACNKQELSIKPVEQEGSTIGYVLDSVPKIINPNSIELYMVNKSDADDQKINGHLLNIGIAVRELLVDNSLNSYILDNVRQSNNKSMNLFTLASNPKIKSSGTGYEKLMAALNNADLTHKSQNPLKSGVVEEYEAAIIVPNIEIADWKLQPLVCPGFEVNSELPGMDDYEDYIVAWYYDEEGILNEILINEETALKTTNPVYIIVNGSTGITEESEKQTECINPSGLKNSTDFIEYQTLGYQINHRYENSGNSEFYITACRFDEQGVVHTMLKNNGNWDIEKKINDVAKNDIGKLLSKRAQFCSDEVLPFSTNYAFYNTFERDWYTDFRTLGSATRYGKTIYLSGEMKFENEWYAFDPTTLGSNSVDFQTIYTTGSKWNTNTKGKLQFVWVNVAQ